MNVLEYLVKKKNESRVVRLILHVVLWLIYGLIGFYFNTISLNIFSKTQLAWAEPLCNVINLVIFYYPLMYFTWPVLLKKKKYILGVLVLLAQVLVYTVLFEIQERWLVKNCESCLEILRAMPSDMQGSINQPLTEGIFNSLFTLGIVYILIARLSPVISIKLLLDYIKERTATIELEKENILLEFNFLKSQVNPHFLFNTLNNVNSLVIQDRNQDASATISKLSDFLRHSLYESGEEKISLGKEIKLLEDYVALEKLRLNSTVVRFDADAVNPDLMVPPLLFIPLVENAFKYTPDGSAGNAYIDIRIFTEGRTLHVEVENSVGSSNLVKGGGIGLKNLEKRLQNYFPSKHQFIVDHKDNRFNVKISIEL